MMKPSVLNGTMNMGWLEFLKTKPDLTQTLAWILENVDEKKIKQFLFVHTKIKVEH